MQRFWLVVGALAAGCGKAAPKTSAEECAALKDKVRPVLEAMARDEHKPLPRAKEDLALTAFCEPPTRNEDKAFRTCLLEASGDRDVAACLLPAFEAYRKASVESREKITAIQAKRAADLAALDAKEAADQARIRLDTALPPTDAASPDAAPAIDLAKVATLELTDHTPGKAGGETQLIAVDANADSVLVSLWPKEQSLLSAASGKQLTGQLVAPSTTAAAKTLATLEGITGVPIAKRGHGVTVDLRFAAAPQRDLFRLIAETAHVDIVAAPGALPDVDIVAKRLDALDILDALVALDHLQEIRVDRVIYLLPAGAKLPPLRTIAGGPTSLLVTRGTPRAALAALAADSPIPLTSCDTTTLTLSVHRVPPAEAVRAVMIASRLTLDGSDACPVPEATTAATTATVSAIATVGTKRVAVIEGATGAATLIRPAKDIEVGNGYVTFKRAGSEFSLQARPDDPAVLPDTLDYQPWLAELERTAYVIRVGTTWRAELVTKHGKPVRLDLAGDSYGIPFELRSTPPKIDAAGVTFQDGAMIPLTAK